MGEGGAETFTSWRAEGERRGIPFGSVFIHECFSSCPSQLKIFYSLNQS